MAIRLGRNNYGKSRIRLLRVVRNRHGHEIKELTLAIRLEGDFDQAHTEGDNSKVLPTDTMKNTVYVLAQQQPVGSIETFSQRLIKHFLDTCPEVKPKKICGREFNPTARPTLPRSSAPERRSELHRSRQRVTESQSGRASGT
jgi:urate oxidase